MKKVDTSIWFVKTNEPGEYTGRIKDADVQQLGAKGKYHLIVHIVLESGESKYIPVIMSSDQSVIKEIEPGELISYVVEIDPHDERYNTFRQFKIINKHT